MSVEVIDMGTSPACRTCRHWEQQRAGDGSSETEPLFPDPDRGYCRVITQGGPPFDAGAEIVGGGQGVSEPIRLETRASFSCALWEALFTTEPGGRP